MNKTPFKILLDKDLSETQVYTTIQTYDRFAKDYADKWEWNPKTIKEINTYNIQPFVKYAKRNGTVLIIGCQTGRDLSILSKKGYSCFGIEFSHGLLTEAVKRVPEGMFAYHYPTNLPFMPESLDSIYADALTIIPKRDMKNTLEEFKIFLKKNGMLYLSVKVGEGNVMVLEDLGGKRFFTLYKKEEILTFLNSAGFEVLWSSESSNTDETLPNWFSVIAKK